jgi:hypothetical protein
MKRLPTFFTITTFLLSTAAFAAPGEYWEVTNKMEMPGMPFAMPATTTKVCIPKGSESDPGKSSGDKDCKMTDMKTVGNKTSWKARCDHNGEVMTGTGEQITRPDGYDGKVQFAGKSRGQEMNMNMVFSGKRIGGSCDTEEAGKKMKAQICDSSRYRTTADWIGGSSLILGKNAACADQRKQLCDLVNKDAPRDVQTYTALVQHDKMMGNDISVAQECGLNMTATTKSICKTLNSKNYRELSAFCPAEAKVYREVVRRKECEGRSYTAETRAQDLKNCLIGVDDSSSSSSDEDSGQKAAAPSPRQSDKSSGSSGSSLGSDALEGAKKLKGLFGL